ncbi:sn-glycerol-3-phosphate ABC transporter ATP-binding protein UgpC [Nordella sp. HKS 07]|uniref:ABC transporter ATP-binding protein n=1 Tax=Nordella sp. HKS 07 TaxID=2712222 RepID=UPI0013E19950|nr:sn-glycerol-3-phosphate ABC transporter ATP-binding protein UgpC [Nordella sp. HKS 07]QIG49734.1 sn-glycerol-3-phosphate ABC transporter ATP-binding protein UgpC [Nordella sp. HKS 07]
MASISLTNVHKFYPNGYAAVRDVSLDIRDGEFMILLGPSGCGKSTTLRMIAGLETISAGDLHIGGARMNDIDPADRDIAIVFQNYALYPHMTVIDNLSFGLRLRGVERAVIDRRVANIADMLGIAELLARKPAQLSGGQRQRVALGRALVREPKAFLLDEPLSNLDAKLRSAMRTELIKLHRALGTTIVHVTHDQVEAMTMGERICIMKDGVIVQVGAPMEVYRNPVNTFVAGFLASPPMNLLRGRLASADLSLGNAVLTLPPPLVQAFAGHSGREVIVGLRPEDLHLKADAAPLTRPIEVNAVATEVLGPEVILVASVSGAPGIEIHIRCPRDFRAAPGEAVTFHYDVSQLQLFDPETTYALKRPVQI